MHEKRPGTYLEGVVGVSSGIPPPTLEGVGVPADPAAQGKLLAGGRMLDVERTLLALHGQALGAHGALGQLALGDVGYPLEVVVACVAKVSRAWGRRTREVNIVVNRFSYEIENCPGDMGQKGGKDIIKYPKNLKWTRTKNSGKTRKKTR